MKIASEAQVGVRVRRWRDRLELTYDEVSRRSGVPVDRLEEVERGETSFSAFEVYRIAQALAADPGALLTEREAVGDLTRGAVRFKREDALAGVGAADRRLLAVGAEVGRVGASLCHLLGRGPTKLPAWSTPLSPARHPWEQGYELGSAARAALGLGLGHLPCLIESLEGLGVHVAFVEFTDDDINAAAIREPDALPVVLVNRAGNRAFERRSLRPLLAHELCHLLHDNGSSKVLTVVSRTSDHEEGLEQRANAFAPAFLAPPASVDSAPLSDEALALRLVEDWCFSVQGASWHVKNLRRLSQERAHEIAQSIRAAGAAIPAGSEAPNGTGEALPAQPSAVTYGLVSRLAGEAWAAGLISEGRAREIAQIH